VKNLPKLLIIILSFFLIFPFFYSGVYAQATVVCDLNSHTEAPCKDVNGNIIGYETAECKGPIGITYAVVTKSCSGGGGGGGGGSVDERIVGRVHKDDWGNIIKDVQIKSDDGKTANWSGDAQDAFYEIGRWPKNTETTISVVPEAGYTCEWSFNTNPGGAGGVSTGNGCSAKVILVNGSQSPDWQNHLHFRLFITAPLISPTPVYTCSDDGKTATVNWNKISEASFYSVRLDGENNGGVYYGAPSCSAGASGLNGDYCFDTPNKDTLSAVVGIKPSTDNRFWIHSKRYNNGVDGDSEWSASKEVVINCQASISNDPPVCQPPVLTPPGLVSLFLEAKGTAFDDKGIARTGVYIYSRNPSTHIREVLSNNTPNTKTTFTSSWDLKDDNGVVVPDGNYEIHYNWYDAEGEMVQCRSPFTKTIQVSDAVYSCSAGIRPTTFEFTPIVSKTLDIVLNSTKTATVKVLWSDTVGFGTFNLSNTSAFQKTYPILPGTNTLSVDWKANPNISPLINESRVQARVISIDPPPISGLTPICSDATITKAAVNQVVWSGKAIWSDNACPVDPGSSDWNTSPALPGTKISIGGKVATTDTDGLFTISKDFYGTSVDERVNASKSGDYEFICFKNDSSVILKSTTNINWNLTTFLPGDYNITPYFRFSPPAFIVANNGEVYSRHSVNLNKPNDINPTYFQTSSSDTLGGLVLSKGEILSDWNDKTTQNYSEVGLKNYNLDLGIYLDKLITALNKGDYDITGQDIVYVDSSSTKLVNGKFNVSIADLISLYENKVLIVDADIEITDSDNFGSSKVKTYIMATGNVSIVSTINKPENILKVLGGIFSKQAILLNRDKSPFNDGYKDPTIEFNADSEMYVRDNLDVLKVVNIKWRELF